MMRVLNCVVFDHNPWLVVLAALVCVGGGWVGLRLFRRGASRSGRQRSAWNFLAAVAVGASVWCTHFIAMLAYETKAPISFEPVLTMVSLLIVIAGSAIAFHLASRRDPRTAALGGGILGAAIAGMHYSGMMAYHVDGIVSWDMGYVVVSVVLSVALGMAALLTSAKSHPVTALVLFVAAVVSLHFTGMAGVSVEPFISDYAWIEGHAAAAMAVAVAGVSLLIVGTGVASYMIDSDTEEQSVRTLRQMALNDTLTGLPNRVSLTNHVENEIHRAEVDGRRLAVVGIDLDKFKEINDLRGHQAGDQALQIIGARLLDVLRDGEFVARVGGDEFTAVKRFTEIAELHDFVGRLETELFAPMRIDDLEVTAGAALGVSVYPHDGDTVVRLISNADLAMYRAKGDVNLAVCYYEAAMDEAARLRRDLARELRQAIALNQFELHYQVQESVAHRGAIVGYEVLLRWNHPERGFVSPADFIPLAEETGTIIQIGEWVLRQACFEAVSNGFEAKIAVNISAIQLSHTDLPRLVERVLAETGLPASMLELEITETSIIQDKARALHALRRVQELGVTVAIDDFGTGYSSLETLRSFPFDRIKLDRSFMHELEESAQARAIVRAVLALGRSLEISVLAEGVETESQLELLRREGCHEAQGFLLGRPRRVVPAALARQAAAA